MAKSPAVRVVIPPESVLTTEIIAEHLVAMSDGIKKLLAGPLTEDTLVLLIQQAAPTVPGSRGYLRVKVGTRDIKAVLRGIEALAKAHLKPKKL